MKFVSCLVVVVEGNHADAVTHDPLVSDTDALCVIFVGGAKGTDPLDHSCCTHHLVDVKT